MSLLRIDTEALDREEKNILSMFSERGDHLAEKLGFTLVPRGPEGEHAYHKGTAVVYFVGDRRQNLDAWMVAQKGEHGLVAHIYHHSGDITRCNFTRALIDALNRGC